MWPCISWTISWGGRCPCTWRCGRLQVADLDAGGLPQPHGGRLGRAVRPAAGLRDDVPRAHDHAAVPAHPDEGQGLRGGVWRDRTLPGRDRHGLGRGALRPPGRHAGGLADAALLARAATVQPPRPPPALLKPGPQPDDTTPPAAMRISASG